MGWKGVGVGDAFGAAVTNTNGKADCAGAKLPHPASSIPARSMTRKVLFMRYGDFGVIGVRDGVAVLMNVAVGICVSVGADVLVGIAYWCLWGNLELRSRQGRVYALERSEPKAIGPHRS